MKPIVSLQGDGVAVILIPHLERRVHVFSDLRKACDFVGLAYQEPPCTATAKTAYNTMNGCLVALWFRKADASEIAHECLHAVNVIHDYVGFAPDRRNDEMDAYLLGYLVNGVQVALKMLEKQQEKH